MSFERDVTGLGLHGLCGAGTQLACPQGKLCRAEPGASSAGPRLTLKEPKSERFSSSISLQGGEMRSSDGLSGLGPTHGHHPGFGPSVLSQHAPGSPLGGTHTSPEWLVLLTKP